VYQRKYIYDETKIIANMVNLFCYFSGHVSEGRKYDLHRLYLYDLVQ
jgi:hypothetical protein